MFPDRRAQSRGFTLVEVLVVLVITGLVSTILFQGLAQSVRVRRSAGIELVRVQRDDMKTAWYRLIVNSLAPDEPDGGHLFKGGPTSFDGLSTAGVGLALDNTAPITVTLAIDAASDTTAVRAGSVELLRLPGTDYAFRYVDDAGPASEVWPRRTLDPTKQLPGAIWIVDTQRRPTSETIVASVVGPRDAPPPVRTLLRGTP